MTGLPERPKDQPDRPAPQAGVREPRADRPERVRVTAPRSKAPLAPGRYSVSRELAEQSEVGEIFIRSLIRSQLRLALVVAGGFGVILAGVPVLMVLFPRINDITLFTVPLPWLLLGVGIYPVILVSAALYNRAAARNERRFRQLVDDDRLARPGWPGSQGGAE
jgi:hypothetical protein